MIVKEPISADDETIRKALEQADPTILRTVLYQLTGDQELNAMTVMLAPVMGGAFKTPVVLDVHSDRIREKGLAFLKRYRDEGSPLPPPPEGEQLKNLMDFCAGRRLSSIEREMGTDELAFDDFPRKVEWRSKPLGGVQERFHVLVIGAGLGGIAAGVQLSQMGIPFTIVEKEIDYGGTWCRNSYPDARVDVPSHHYSFSFETTYPWKHPFAPQAELQEYFRHCATKYGLRPHTRFDTEVISAEWDASDAKWQITVRTKDGRNETLCANAIVSAVGLFNRVQNPPFKGFETFTGKTFHTAEWDHSFDYKNKKVGVIGTGPSTMQLVPKVAADAQRLTIFQRTPGWVIPVPGYREPFSPEQQWLFRYVPYYDNWYRFRQYASFFDNIGTFHVMDPEWKTPGSINLRNQMVRESLTEYLMSKIGHRPDLVEKCVPHYPAFAKRVIMDNGWFDTLLRENVELVINSIERVTERGVITTSGTEYDLDLLVMGTGYKTNDFLWPIRIRGVNGAVLEEVWSRDGARAHLGITIPHFPNLFCLYGPNTNPKTGAIFFWEELQMRYIAQCLRELIESNRKSLDCRQEVCDAYNDRMDDALKSHIWMDPSQKSYYRNDFGRVDVNMPWNPEVYFDMIRSPKFEDYEIR